MTKFPILLAAKTAYRDLLHVVLAMPILIGGALVIIVALGLLESFIAVRGEESSMLGKTIEFIFSVAQNFFLTPIMIAGHRFIILGEVTSAYRLDPRHPTFRAFFAWLLALLISNFLLTFLFDLAPPDYLTFVLFAVLIVLGLIALLSVVIRLVILLPAIAVEAPAATAAHAWADSAGHLWRIFLIFLVATLPVAVVAMILVFAIAYLDSASLLVLAILIGAVLQVIGLVLYVAIASRLFEAMAHRLIEKTSGP